MAKEDKKQKKSCSVKRKTSIGGQALMEGIMMRGPKKSAMAVRNPQGEIVFEEHDLAVNKRPRITKLPIIRGVFGFVDSLVTGYKYLMRSAEICGLEEAEEELAREKAEKKERKREELLKQAENDPKKAARLRRQAEKEAAKQAKAAERERKEAEKAAKDPKYAAKREKNANKKESSALTTGIMIGAMVIAFAIMIVVFIGLPTLLFSLLTTYVAPALLFPESPALASLVKSAFEGFCKVFLLVGYMALVSLMSDIRRTYEYHGAEHKTIFCYEHGKALTVENVRAERRFHPRCGTSFLILMVLVSIFVSFFIDPIAIAVTGDKLPGVLRTVVRFALLPVVMGLGYEVLKFAGRHENLFTRIISAPGMWLQHITVREPEDGMIECAIRAFLAVIPEEEIDEEMAKIAAESGSGVSENAADESTAPTDTDPPEAEPPAEE